MPRTLQTPILGVAPLARAPLPLPRGVENPVLTLAIPILDPERRRLEGAHQRHDPENQRHDPARQRLGLAIPALDSARGRQGHENERHG